MRAKSLRACGARGMGSWFSDAVSSINFNPMASPVSQFILPPAMAVVEQVLPPQVAQVIAPITQQMAPAPAPTVVTAAQPVYMTAQPAAAAAPASSSTALSVLPAAAAPAPADAVPWKWIAGGLAVLALGALVVNFSRGRAEAKS